MQKVEGSSPFSRLKKSPGNPGLFLFSRARTWGGSVRLVAVAKASYEGSGGGARVPGVLNSITAELFKPVAARGLGLNKLQFYSQRNGFGYVSLDKLRGATG